MEVLDEIATLGLIKKQMRRSRTARLAVAFWGLGAARNLGISERRDCVEIICNLSQGGTNPDEIRSLMGLPQVGCDRILQNDRLHAKVYLFDDLAIVGSSNASTNGLRLEGNELKGWLEANAVITDADGLAFIRTMFDERFRGRPITETDLLNAERARERLPRREPPNSRTILDVLISEPELVRRLELYFAAYDEPLSRSGDREEKKVMREYGPSFGVFESWPTIPREAPIVCFWIGPRGGMTQDGTWIVAPAQNDREGGRYQIAQRVEKACGFEVKQNDARWRQIFNWVRQSDMWITRDGGMFVPMSEIADAIASAVLRLV